MDENLVKDFIEHHGVLGMKWGRRGSASSRGPASSESTRVSALKTRPKHTLTNKQLKIVNDRMNLEKSFSNMNPSTISRGLKAAAAIAAVGSLAMNYHNMVTSNAGKAIISVGKKALRMKQYGQMKLF